MPLALREAYQTLLLAVMKGERALFVRNDEIGGGVEVLRSAHQPGSPGASLHGGLWGPDAANKLIEAWGQGWTNP